MQFSCFAVLLLAVLMNVSLGFELTEQEMKASKGKFCGPHLSDMLSLVCGGVYNSVQKRNRITDELNKHEVYEEPASSDYSEESLPAFPFQSKHIAKSIIPSEFRKRSHGVASECCHKACSLWEMAGYCGDQ